MERAILLKILVNHQNIRLTSPVMNLKKAASEHTEVRIRGILEPEDGSQDHVIVPELDIEIFDEGADRLLFRGIVRAVDLRVETVHADPMKTIEIEAVSGTFLLDREKKNRSFQKTSMDYYGVAQLVLQDHKDSGIMLCPEMEGIPLGKLIVQYEETDWQFLKRLMSRFNQPLIPVTHLQGPKCYAGVLERGDLWEIGPEEELGIREHYDIRQGEEGGHLEYIWISEEPDLNVMEVGDGIRYKKNVYYVKSADLTVGNSSIYHQYVFCLKSGFRTREIQNPYMTGLALPGNIKRVSGDQVQIKMDLDAVAETDCWYSYSTFYSTFYCMPEVGDRVQLYMPSSREEQAFVLNSIRDKPAASTSGGGKFQASNREQQEKAPLEQVGGTGRQETNLLAWLKESLNLSPAEFLGMNLGLADGTGERQDPNGAGAGGGKGGGGGAGASYSGNGRQLEAPSFDFQDLSGNEGVKVLSTKDNKMVILDDNKGSVTIYYSDGSNIILNGNGVSINSEGVLNITATGNVNITAEGALNMEASEKMSITCMDSSLTLTPVGVGLMGTDIKINE